jgi:adenylate cyclase
MVGRWVDFTKGLNKSLLEQAHARMTKTLVDGIQIDMSTEECKKLLRRHIYTKINLVTLFVVIINSTEMSLTLPETKFALILQSFAQELTIAISGYGGYVFKYEGDAVIALFPTEYNEEKACRNALDCSRAILRIINEIINPAFNTNQLPQITVRIGMAYGYALVVLYGKSLENSHIDVVGSSISLATKIASIANPNQILIGESIYNIFQSSASSSSSSVATRRRTTTAVGLSPKDLSKDNTGTASFREIELDPTKWKYLSRSDPHSLYRVYESY